MDSDGRYSDHTLQFERDRHIVTSRCYRHCHAILHDLALSPNPPPDLDGTLFSQVSPLLSLVYSGYC